MWTLRNIQQDLKDIQNEVATLKTELNKKSRHKVSATLCFFLIGPAFK